MGSGGGTKMWCPECESIEVCRAIPAADVTYDTSDYCQRKYFTGHDDLQFFQRGRQCLECGYEFLTGEINLQFLTELTDLRDALSDLKKHAEQYSEESKKASKSLNKLSKSLGALKALKLYQEN
jgi:hypothetical protein